MGAFTGLTIKGRPFQASGDGAVRGGRISAALDVTDPEPLPSDHPLWTLPNAIVTSHTANTTRLGSAAMALRVGENVARFARGEEPLGLVDPVARY